MPFPAGRRRRVVFERRTQQRQSSAAHHATSPPHLDQRATSSTRTPPQPPEDVPDQPSSSSTTTTPAFATAATATATAAGTTAAPGTHTTATARTGPLPPQPPPPAPLRPDPGVRIELPPLSPQPASAPVADPAAAAYLFPTPPPPPLASSAGMADDSAAPAAAAAATATSPNAQRLPGYLRRDDPAYRRHAFGSSSGSESALLQRHTVEECLPYLTGQAADELGAYNAAGVPKLKRESHVDFLKETLELMAPGWVAIDSSRPWVLYWAFAGLSMLGEDLSEYEDRAIGNFTAAQNPGGGFGGGHGQQSHLAGAYAGILCLIMLGEKALDVVDRRSMWHWLGRLKQASGGFAVSEGAEIDCRGAYCSMVLISILNLPLELPPDSPAREAGLTSFTDKLPQWLSRCQTYEGGISAQPGSEAHGAYAFCAIACACILGEPQTIIPEIFDLPMLISWLSARQYAPEGGFAGRTNKLVDGCYSHWVGGCWPLIDAAVAGSGTSQSPSSVSEGLYSREGLIRYILCCCQQEDGGLRDKPSKSPDGYHSCYVLAGLSAAQHHVAFEPQKTAGDRFDHAFHWSLHSEKPLWQGVERLELDNESIVKPLHPVYVVPFEAIERARDWSMHKTGF